MHFSQIGQCFLFRICHLRERICFNTFHLFMVHSLSISPCLMISLSPPQTFTGIPEAKTHRDSYTQTNQRCCDASSPAGFAETPEHKAIQKIRAQRSCTIPQGHYCLSTESLKKIANTCTPIRSLFLPVPLGLHSEG